MQAVSPLGHSRDDPRFLATIWNLEKGTVLIGVELLIQRVELLNALLAEGLSRRHWQ